MNYAADFSEKQVFLPNSNLAHFAICIFLTELSFALYGNNRAGRRGRKYGGLTREVKAAFVEFKKYTIKERQNDKNEAPHELVGSLPSDFFQAWLAVENLTRRDRAEFLPALLWILVACYENRFAKKPFFLTNADFCRTIGRRVGLLALHTAAHFLEKLTFSIRKNGERQALFSRVVLANRGIEIQLDSAVADRFFTNRIELTGAFFSELNNRQMRETLAIVRQCRLGNRCLKITDLMRDAGADLGALKSGDARQRLAVLEDLKKIALVMSYEFKEAALQALQGVKFFTEGVVEFVYCAGAMADKVLSRIPTAQGLFNEAKRVWRWFVTKPPKNLEKQEWQAWFSTGISTAELLEKAGDVWQKKRKAGNPSFFKRRARVAH